MEAVKKALDECYELTVEHIHVALLFGHEDIAVYLTGELDEENSDSIDELIMTRDSVVLYKKLQKMKWIDSCWAKRNFKSLIRYGAVNVLEYLDEKTDYTGTIMLSEIGYNIPLKNILRLYKMGRIHVNPKGVLDMLRDFVKCRSRGGMHWLLSNFGNNIFMDEHSEELYRIAEKAVRGHNNEGILEILHQYGVLVVKEESNVLLDAKNHPFLKTLPEFIQACENDDAVL